MRYIARSPIKYRDEDKPERTIAPGRPVPDHLVDDGLLECGAVEAVDDQEETTPAKPLSKMTRAELDAVVAAEEVDVGEATTNAAIAVAIEAHRARQSDGG